MRNEAKLSITLGILAMLAVAATPATTPAPAGTAPADGKTIFTKSKCTMCHTIDSQEIKQLVVEGEEDDVEKPKDLSDVGSRRDADWIKRWLNKEVEIDGKTHRKRFGGQPAELDVLAKWLTSLKAK